MPDKHPKSPKDLLTLLNPYNPWWAVPAGEWRANLPEYQRPVVRELLADLAELPQMISITGPRRVGKTTALKQVIRHLLDREKIESARILYFSFDDPEVYGSADLQRSVFEQLVAHAGAKPSGAGRWYFFLDEIQRLPKWELHLKGWLWNKTVHPLDPSSKDDSNSDLALSSCICPV